MLYLAAREHGPAANYPIQRVVIHGTVSPCVVGGALAIARMFHTSTRPASTQKVHDPATSIRCVPDSVIAYGAPPNKGSLHHELCDPQGGSPSRWQDANHQSMLRVAARDVAADCLKYDIPIRKISAGDLLAGRKGICGHADVSAAWHQTDHVDPGPDFPWSQFLALVQSYAHPTPAPTPKKVHKMQWLARTAGLSAVFLCDGINRRWVQDGRQEASIQERLKAFGLSDAVSDYAPGELLSGIAGVLVGPDAPTGTY